MGFPLSLQAAYALLIGEDGERGKISLQKFQVYANLKRCGYNVLRALLNSQHPLHHQHHSQQPSWNETLDPFTIHYHVWKSAQKWTKLRHPPPDFRLAIVDAQSSSVPTLAEISPLRRHSARAMQARTMA
ncbi:tRNA-splicing endonuclease subunit sen54 [Collariella sp. IMI 366227]|nr:tRNA-splicing endonuclease subunit sen54 [Collariella sp. IMI 366227]